MERVCFIRPKGEPGPILVMGAAEPSQLLAIIQAGNPQELELMGTVDGVLYPEEWWHDTLSPWRLRGAWYDSKAQVLCRVEDGLRGALEAPERLDPTEDPFDPLEEPSEPSERVPEHVLAKVETPAQRAARRWAFPEVEPYPDVDPDLTPTKHVLPLLRKLAQAAA